MSVIKITSENFESEVLKAEKPVLVTFGQNGVDHVE